MDRFDGDLKGGHELMEASDVTQRPYKASCEGREELEGSSRCFSIRWKGPLGGRSSCELLPQRVVKAFT
jgi:hypothetical protein